MKGDIDPTLLHQLEQAGDKGEVEALILLSNQSASSDAQQAEGGPGKHIVEHVAAQVNEQPSQVRYISRLGALYIKGSGKLIRQLLESDQVTAASANQGELSAGV